ncbi:NAD-dependent deacetylase sirtuin-7 [Diaporthe amygdali]|uniref:NAD-dependent deacetylase sirtuin-7 n=1 Tax=Phomopsis amygdali TaxID=1214568 RepID=UPI0022FDD1E5|nr:NAD-dependent deacetylase sirtuin-7 [Diaporthe amygdali]KAJ0114160.1 NAD-dependent deacetylase sirtuin-7 [Diaporthe amygdali]
MADTAPKIAEVEREEAPAAVDRKARALADQIRRSKHLVVFTGAGVSTSAGIADFRGPEGAWTLMAQGREHDLRSIDTLQAIPTPTHMALVELQSRGILKYLISQNCDGLHRRSGILPGTISEVHGNSNREYCKDCGKEYIRDFRAVAPDERPAHDHRTGRKCAICGGILLDSIINFGEPLPEADLQRAFDNAEKADVFLVLGSSLTVTPANEIPEIPGRKRAPSLAICNLQKTPLDGLADLRVFSKSDDLMVRVMNQLEIPIPQFILRRSLIIRNGQNARGKFQLHIVGIDIDGTPYFRGGLDPGTQVELELEFMGNYGEPNLCLTHEYGGQADEAVTYDLRYNPADGNWDFSRASPPN